MVARAQALNRLHRLFLGLLAGGDAGPQVAGVGQAAGVEGHPLVAGGADFLEENGDFRVAGGGVKRQGLSTRRPRI